MIFLKGKTFAYTWRMMTNQTNYVRRCFFFSFNSVLNVLLLCALCHGVTVTYSSVDPGTTCQHNTALVPVRCWEPTAGERSRFSPAFFLKELGRICRSKTQNEEPNHLRLYPCTIMCSKVSGLVSRY
jgi:hypothetical protein